jgi:hypothetical protein
MRNWFTHCCYCTSFYEKRYTSSIKNDRLARDRQEGEKYATFTLTQNRVLVVHDYIVAGTGRLALACSEMVIVISNKKETLLSAVGTDELI